MAWGSLREIILATKPFAREQRGRSWWSVLSTAALLTGLLTASCLDLAWWWRLLPSIVAGLVMVRMFVLYHDYLHGAILRQAWLARPFFWLYGLVILSPPSIWRRTHDHHHQHNGRYFFSSVGTYQILTIAEYGHSTRRQRLAYVVERHPLTMLLGYLSIFACSMCLRYLVRAPRRHWDGGLALLLHAMLLTGLAIYSPSALVFAVLLPMSLAAALGSYLFYAQHNYPAAKYHEPAEWNYVAAALESSSFLRLHPILHWLTGNIGYHHVHHVNARIPFYRLPEAMARITALQTPGTTSLWPWEIYRCLRLKLWDPARKRLVTFAEAQAALAMLN